VQSFSTNFKAKTETDQRRSRNHYVSFQRQKKKYFPLSQCFPKLQANSTSAKFSKNDYTDFSWSRQVILPEGSSCAFTNLDHQVKIEHNQKDV